MFRTAKQLKACSLLATDGEIGRVKDLLFDSLRWGLRYFIVDTGHWARHHEVLISPESVRAPEWERNTLPVSLTRDQVRHSPGLERDKPVSRQYEEAMRTHYGWPPYWGVMYADSIAGVPPAPGDPGQPVTPSDLEGDPHLFSVDAVTGHHVMATDGEIGHVEEFLFDSHRWKLRYLVVATRNWLPGRKVILSPWWASELDWPSRLIYMGLTRDAIKASPPYDPEKTLTLEAAGELHDYYGRPRWSEQEAVGESVVRSDNPDAT